LLQKWEKSIWTVNETQLNPPLMFLNVHDGGGDDDDDDDDNDDDDYYVLHHVDGVRLRLCTAATSGPIVHPPRDI
jgi:hypothetical protein